MRTAVETEIKQETAVLIGLINKQQSDEQVEEYLDELQFLTETAGAKTLKRFTQRLEKPDVRTFLGSGKIEQVRFFVEESKADMVIFDDELSPVQIRNVEKIMKCKVIDRSHLILDIFSQRAQTAHAKTQVEIAQYEYLLPRLAGMWTHLERQRGGIGTRGGSGEKEIETDKRIVKARISLLKNKLAAIDKQMATQRSNRGSMVRVSLVGYTNVGKSTIMNLISKSQVFAEDKLFATLDTTVRKVVIENLPFLLSDTVGFIRKLPHQLVESFKSTLDEVREADLLLHVVDISHPRFEEQIRVVNQTLTEIKVIDKPVLLVFNKIDRFVFETDEFSEDGKSEFGVEAFRKSWMSKNDSPAVFISAWKKQNIDEFKKVLYDSIKEIHIKRYPYNHFLY